MLSLTASGWYGQRALVRLIKLCIAGRTRSPHFPILAENCLIKLGPLNTKAGVAMLTDSARPDSVREETFYVSVGTVILSFEQSNDTALQTHLGTE